MRRGRRARRKKKQRKTKKRKTSMDLGRRLILAALRHLRSRGPKKDLVRTRTIKRIRRRRRTRRKKKRKEEYEEKDKKGPCSKNVNKGTWAEGWSSPPWAICAASGPVAASKQKQSDTYPGGLFLISEVPL